MNRNTKHSEREKTFFFFFENALVFVLNLPPGSDPVLSEPPAVVNMFLSGSSVGTLFWVWTPLLLCHLAQVSAQKSGSRVSGSCWFCEPGLSGPAAGQLFFDNKCVSVGQLAALSAKYLITTLSTAEEHLS